MGDARLELEDALSGVAENAGRDEAGTPTQGEHRARVQSRVAGAVALILGGLGVFLAWRDLTRRPDARPVARLGVDVPRGLALRDARPAVSPDGRHLALAVRGVDSRLWVRSLETGETQPLAGTEGARGPFRSPDGADIGFLCLETSGVIVLKRVGFPAGGVQTICSVPGTNSSSAAWSGEGRILFAAGDNGGVRIHSVPSAGGDPRVVLEPDATAGELGHWWPQFLPDGRRFLFGVSSSSWEPLGTWVASLDAPHEKRLLLPGVFAAQLSSTGHLLYIRDGNLVAHPFDTGRAELTGEPMKVDYALEEPQVSPDGRWLAYSADVTDEWEVYVTPFRRPGPKVRVSPGGGRQPRWRGDGRELFYVTARGELMAVEVREIDDRLEAGRPSRLFDAGVSDPAQDEYGVTKDGQRFLVVTPVEEWGWSLKAILNWPGLLE